MFSTLVFIILTWGFISVVFVGIGLLFQRIWGELNHSFEVILDSFWLGFAFSVFFLQIWNFYFPVDIRSFYILSGAGLSGILLNFKTYLSPFFRINVAFILLIGIVAIFLAGVASFPYIRTDHGAYYSNSIEWAKLFPIIKGLGNLNSGLAYNNSYFLFAAWIESFPWIKKSHHFVSGALFMGLLIQILYSYLKILGTKSISKSSKNTDQNNLLNSFEIQHIFYVFMFWPAIFFIQTSRIASPAPDTAVSIVEIVLFAKLLEFSDQHFSSNKAVNAFFFIVTLSILGACIKASMLAFGATSSVTALVYLLCLRPEQVQKNKSKFFISITIGLFLGMFPCMLRNILVSGYIFYPMTFWGFPVEWRIPYEKSFDEWSWVMSWAREPGVKYSQVLGNMKWFWPWLSNNWKTLFSFKIPLVLAAIGLTGILFRISINRKIRLRPDLWLMFIPILLSLIAWFLSAPDVRFAGSLFWILGISLLVLAMTLWVQNHSFVKIICTLIFLSAVIYLCFKTEKIVEVTIRNAHFLKNQNISINRLKLGPALNDLFNDLPNNNYSTFIAYSGLIIFKPIPGGACWDKILCASNFDKKLRLVRAGDLESGFVIDSSR